MRGNQKVAYNGLKRKHALKYQSISTTNNLFDPVDERCHDSSMLVMSGMMPVLLNFSIGPNGERLCIYVDPAYSLRWYLQSSFRGSQTTPDQNEFNKSMSKVHISIEWQFGNVIENFKFSDYRKSQKTGLSSKEKMCQFSALLSNAHNVCTKTNVQTILISTRLFRKNILDN